MDSRRARMYLIVITFTLAVFIGSCGSDDHEMSRLNPITGIDDTCVHQAHYRSMSVSGIDDADYEGYLFGLTLNNLTPDDFKISWTEAQKVNQVRYNSTDDWASVSVQTPC